MTKLAIIVNGKETTARMINGRIYLSGSSTHSVPDLVIEMSQDKRGNLICGKVIPVTEIEGADSIANIEDAFFEL